jgi:hypothetical protein
MSITNSVMEVNNEALLKVLTNKQNFDQQLIYLVLNRFPSITQPLMVKASNDLVYVFES